MNEVSLYYASVAVCGGVIGAIGLSGMLSGASGLVSGLLTIGGAGMVVGPIHEAILSDTPDASAPDRRLRWISIGCAVLVIVAGLWSLLG